MERNDRSTTHIFGPVPSRRLGLSLGVDLIPAKTCTYDCLYCQVGKTTHRRTRRGPFVPVGEVLSELEERLKEVTPDFITLSGSGEPTLYSGIGALIEGIRARTGARIALITNGSLLWNEQVRKGIAGADLILPTLCTTSEETFRLIHRPAESLRLERVIEGMRRLRREFRRDLFLEVMLLRGINDSEMELESLKRAVREISPDRIQLNTVVRPPSDPDALPLDSARMEAIKTFLGPPAEVIASFRSGGGPSAGASDAFAMLEMARRRPVRVSDVVRSLKRPPGEVEDVMEGLVRKGMLRRGEHAGEMYYYTRTEPEQ
jgi:wyosine [tRNA(Phe)-imidazoG37] synthetase (radical SAM superfamily)